LTTADRTPGSTFTTLGVLLQIGSAAWSLGPQLSAAPIDDASRVAQVERIVRLGCIEPADRYRRR